MTYRNETASLEERHRMLRRALEMNRAESRAGIEEEAHIHCELANIHAELAKKNGAYDSVLLGDATASEEEDCGDGQHRKRMIVAVGVGISAAAVIGFTTFLLLFSSMTTSPNSTYTCPFRGTTAGDSK